MRVGFRTVANGTDAKNWLDLMNCVGYKVFFSDFKIIDCNWKFLKKYSAVWFQFHAIVLSWRQTTKPVYAVKVVVLLER